MAHHGLLHLSAALDFSGVTKMAMFAVCASTFKKSWGFHGFLENVGMQLLKKNGNSKGWFFAKMVRIPGKSCQNVNSDVFFVCSFSKISEAAPTILASGSLPKPWPGKQVAEILNLRPGGLEGFWASGIHNP